MQNKPHYRRTADGQTVMVSDGLVNLVSGMGTGRDKAGRASYSTPVMTSQEALVAYKAAPLARRIIDLPAQDACREWREWQAKETDISDIGAEEKRLGVQGKVMEARRQARLFGGAAILIGTGDKDPSKPLDPTRLKKGGIKYLTVLGRDDLTTGDIERNITAEGYGLPVVWRGLNQQAIHPSRLVVFHGIKPFSGLAYETQDGWGDSELMGVLERVTALDEVAGNILSLVYEAKVDVIKVPDLMNNLQTRGDAFSAELIKRLTLAATGKGINGTLILDALEEYQQKSASFGSLPDIIDRFMQLCSAVCGIPMTLLFGQSAAGMNSTGEGDARNYYDSVKVEQTLEIQPAMSVLDECLIYSSLGNRPDDLHYTWRPLWQPTAKERAETGKLMTESLKSIDDMQTLPKEVLGKAAVNGLTESGAFPGLEGYANEFYGANGDDEEDPAESGIIERETNDAAPQTLYVHRKLLNAADVIRWAKKQGFKATLPASDMHVTIAFSRSPVDWMECGTSWASKLEIPAGGPRQMEQFGEARVLLFTDHELVWRHRCMKDAGATWDHPDYQPHLTISYDPDAPSIADVEPYQGPLVFGPEIFSTVNEDWAEGVEEE